MGKETTRDVGTQNVGDEDEQAIIEAEKRYRDGHMTEAEKELAQKRHAEWQQALAQHEAHETANRALAEEVGEKTLESMAAAVDSHDWSDEMALDIIRWMRENREIVLRLVKEG